MKVVLPGGEVIELGDTEATPTVSLVDYSRRETDDFGVTTVVQRGFARRVAVRLRVPFDRADDLQRRLAALRAKQVRWVADDRFRWLDFEGFYKDFEIDLAVPPFSYCTLTIEGLVEKEAFTDLGGDPAPNGDTSTLQMLQPVMVTNGVLIASTAAEDDYPEWSAGATYGIGQRVIKAATHRIYESGALTNVGNDPAGASGKWRDIGPTNRWAMFDQALGSVTSAVGSLKVDMSAGAVDAIALIDVTPGSAVRVQTTGYDRTQVAVEGETLTFLDLPGSSDPVAVTVSGPGAIEVGTLLVGALVGLGSTVSSPKAGITDFSRKEADEFGEVTVVERAWAKRMTLQAMIRADALDVVAGRIAGVRARPVLWIGKEGLESLTIYGFFKDFSIAVGETVSTLSLAIEGLSTAGKVEPLKASVDWPDVGDPLGTKPQDNADVTGENTAKDTANVGGTPSIDVLDRIQQARDAIDAINDLAGEILGDFSDLREQVEAGEGEIDELTARVGVGNPNLIPSLEDGLIGASSNAIFTLVDGDDGWGAYAASGTNVANGTAAILYWVYDVTVDQVHFTLAADMGQLINGGTGAHFLQLEALDAANNQLALTNGASRPSGVVFSEDGSARKELACTIFAPVGTKKIRAYAVWYKESGTVQTNVLRQIKLERGQTATPYSSETTLASYSERITAVRSNTQALAQRATNLEAGITGAEARITSVETVAAQNGQAVAQVQSVLQVNAQGQSARLNTVEQVAATAFDRVTGARWSKEAIAGNGRAQLTVYALDNNGNPQAGVDIIGDVSISGDLTVDGTIRTSKIEPNAVSDLFVSYTGGATSEIPKNSYRDLAVLDAYCSGAPMLVRGSTVVDIGNTSKGVSNGFLRVYRENGLLVHEVPWTSALWTLEGVLDSPKALFVDFVDYTTVGWHTYYLHLRVNDDRRSVTASRSLLSIQTLKR